MRRSEAVIPPGPECVSTKSPSRTLGVPGSADGARRSGPPVPRKRRRGGARARRSWMGIAMAFAFGLALVVTGLPSAMGHPVLPEAPPLLIDDFTHDSQLNASLWRIDGSSTVGAASQMYPGTVVSPALGFSAPTGLKMSGVTKGSELTGIESLPSFLPPFDVNLSVLGTDSHGAAFLVVLTNPSFTGWLAVDGYLNSSEGSAYGIGLDALSPRAGSWSYFGNLVSSPTLNRWYDVTIVVSPGGRATVGVAGFGTLEVDIGPGPFVLGLMQAENFPHVVGNNTADWASVSAVPGAVPGLYPVVITEKGLPVGTVWSATVDGSSESSSTATMVFSEPNGMHAYSLGETPGYTATPASGAVNVSGGGEGVNVTFTPSSGHTSGVFGLPGYEGYYVIGGLLAVAIAGAAAAGIALRRRSRGGGSA